MIILRSKTPIILGFLALFGIEGCLWVTSPEDDEPIQTHVHYVGIDIDDVFMPVWNNSINGYTDIKMNSGDVDELVRLAEDMQSEFNPEARISLGYNSDFFDSTNSGDIAFLDNADHFAWFNHFPHHQLIKTKNLSADQIEMLLKAGTVFENEHGLDQYAMSDYCVTPKHEGIWPPYAFLYDAFERCGIKCTTTLEIDRGATYGKVQIMPRTSSNMLSTEYTSAQFNEAKMQFQTALKKDQIMQNTAIIINFHQANFTGDRPGITYLRILMDLVKEEQQEKIIILPSDQIVEKSFMLMQYNRN